MARSRYRTVANIECYFVTSSTVHWIPLFSVPPVAEIIIDSLNFLHEKKCR